MREITALEAALTVVELFIALLLYWSDMAFLSGLLAGLAIGTFISRRRRFTDPTVYANREE